MVGGGPFRFKPCVRLPRYRPSWTDIFISSRSARPSYRDGGVGSVRVVSGWGRLCGGRAGDRINKRVTFFTAATCSLNQTLVVFGAVSLPQLHICSVEPALAAPAAA